MLKVYNSLTNKKEEFKPVEEGKAKVYTLRQRICNSRKHDLLCILINILAI